MRDDATRAGYGAWPWYAALVPLGVLLHIYLTTNLADPLQTLARPLFLSLFAGTIITLALGVLIGYQRAGVAALIVPLAMLDLGPAPNALIAILSMTLITGLVLELLHRTGHLNWNDGTRFVNTMAAAFLVLGAGRWLLAGGPNQAFADVFPERGTPAASAIAAAPDVFVILLDGHPREDTLRDQMAFDESGWVEDLESLGFDSYVDARSNYPNTTFTTASMFNMAYIRDIPGLEAAQHGNVPRQPTFRNSLSNPKAFRVAHAFGYEIVSTDSGWEELSPVADRVVRTGGLTQFEKWLVRHSSGGFILQQLVPSILADGRRDRIETELAKVTDIASQTSERPRLVFAHIPSPHFPLVYGPDGDLLVVHSWEWDWFDLSDASLRDRYVGNLQHLHALVVPAVAEIVRSDPDAVVVLMSDHGSLLDLGGADERVKSLLIARTPGAPGLFGDQPTLVNLFPAIFNRYLAAGLPVQVSHSYRLSTGDGAADWELIEVPPEGANR